jgi:hypothetical protein
MRMMMKIAVPNDGGNRAVKDGSLGRIVGAFMEEHKPESSYFFTENGERTAQFVLDVKDPSQMVLLAEPYFLALNARITLFPVMNPQDLRSGLEKLKL